MNFSDYLNEYNKQSSLNEGEGGLLAASRTKEFHDWFKKATKNADGEYNYIPAVEGEKFVEFICECKFLGTIVVHLDDYARLTGKVEFTSKSIKGDYPSLYRFIEVKKNMVEMYGYAFQEVIDNISKYLNGLNK